MQFRYPGRTGALALCAMLGVSACTVAVDQPGPRPGPGPGGPQYCTQQYEPVCARRGRDRETFPNACTARSEGYDVIARGQCEQRRSPRTPRPDRRPDRRPQLCPQVYQPVCARKNDTVRTYGNDCEARADQARVLYEGQCRGRR